MKKYWVYFLVSLKSESTYKADFILSMAADMVFFFINFIVWKTIYTTGNISSIDNYTLTNTVTYFFVTSLIFRLDASNFLYLGYSIWDGYFTNDLVKPWYVKLADPIICYADMFLNFLLYVPLMLFMLVFTHSFVVLPGLTQLIYFGITLFLALTFGLIINLSFHTLTFFFGDQDNNISIFNYIIAFLAGGFLPLAFLPDTLGKILHVLPFRFLFDVPVNVYLGKIGIDQLLGIWGQMILWMFAFYVIFHYLFKFGLRRYSGVGR